VAEPLLHAAAAALIAGALAHVPVHDAVRAREEIMGRLVAAGQVELARQVANAFPSSRTRSCTLRLCTGISSRSVNWPRSSPRRRPPASY